MQFLFRPQSLVLFCRINTLDRGKKQEGQGLMVNSRHIFGKEGGSGRGYVISDISQILTHLLGTTVSLNFHTKPIYSKSIL